MADVKKVEILPLSSDAVSKLYAAGIKLKAKVVSSIGVVTESFLKATAGLPVEVKAWCYALHSAFGLGTLPAVNKAAGIVDEDGDAIETIGGTLAHVFAVEAEQARSLAGTVLRAARSYAEQNGIKIARKAAKRASTGRKMIVGYRDKNGVFQKSDAKNPVYMAALAKSFNGEVGGCLVFTTTGTVALSKQSIGDDAVFNVLWDILGADGMNTLAAKAQGFGQRRKDALQTPRVVAK